MRGGPSIDFKVGYKSEGEPSLRWWHHPVDHFGGRTVGVCVWPTDRVSRRQPTHQRRQDQCNGERRHSMPHIHSEWTTAADGYVPVPWVPDYRRWRVYDGIPYQVKQRAGDRGITVENMEKAQHTDFKEDATNESVSLACSNVRLWKLDSQKAWRNTSSRLYDERTGKKFREWVLNEAGVKRKLLDTTKARKLAYYCHTMRKQGSYDTIRDAILTCARKPT